MCVLNISLSNNLDGFISNLIKITFEITRDYRNRYVVDDKIYGNSLETESFLIMMWILKERKKYKDINWF